MNAMKPVYTFAVFAAFIVLVVVISANQEANEVKVEDPYEAKLENYLMDKRSCIRRGNGCDARPNDCCEGSTCRCNLWGTNCRCQRSGLLEKWGK